MPLMISWALMGLEYPMVTATVARLENPEAELAATSGIVFPIALLIEAPIIMLLAAATALVKDRKTERWLARFVMVSAWTLTAVHLLVACTPLFGLVVGDLLQIDERLHASGQLGLILAAPWPGAIAWRRFRQGILIRAERSGDVGRGTLVRLLTDVGVLGTGFLVAFNAPEAALPGAALAGLTLGCGVLAEGLYAEWCARPVVRRQFANDDPAVAPLEMRSFFGFYAPLAMTPFLTLGIQPLVSATINRMPDRIANLACLGPVYGLIFLLRSAGFAYQEVVVASFERPGAELALSRAARTVAIVVTAIVAAMVFTPVGSLWFGRVAGLDDRLVGLALDGLTVAVGFPALSIYLHLAQGRLVAKRRTRQVTAGVLVYSAVAVAGLALGAITDAADGVVWCIGVLFAAALAQTVWVRRAASGP
jgi:hypothetical protein